jgi:putative ABC transport system substrate-binding protein
MLHCQEVAMHTRFGSIPGDKRYAGSQHAASFSRLRIGILIALALGVLVVPRPTVAQKREKIPLVGVLDPNPATVSRPGCLAFFQQGLRDLGYVEGQNIVLEYRYADHQLDRLPALTAELVRLTPDVIWTHSNVAALAAKQAITTIPVVIGAGQDMTALGIVESLARPSGNLTGLDVRVFELMGKRLELLKEAVPTITRVAVLVDPTNPLSKEVPHNIAREARALNVQLQRVEVGEPETFEGTVAALIQGGADAVMLPEGPPFGPHSARFLELARRHRLPTVCGPRDYAEAGCLLAYGANPTDLCQRSAVLVHKILQGAKPADLPVELGYKFSLSVNLKTAELLGLTLPPTFLHQADQVIK